MNKLYFGDCLDILKSYFDKKSLSMLCDKIQIVSVEDLMEGKNIQLPQAKTTLKIDSNNQQERLF